MANYVVTWSVDIYDAANPKEAAEAAWDVMRDPETSVGIFDVTDEDGDGEAVMVRYDSEDEGPRCEVCGKTAKDVDYNCEEICCEEENDA